MSTALCDQYGCHCPEAYRVPGCRGDSCPGRSPYNAIKWKDVRGMSGGSTLLTNPKAWLSVMMKGWADFEAPAGGFEFSFFVTKCHTASIQHIADHHLLRQDHTASGADLPIA